MHPNNEQLIAYLDGSADRKVRQHLDADCAACGPRIESIRAVMATMRADRDPDPPATWVTRAVALIAPVARPSILHQLRDWVGGLAEDVARVVSDSGALPGDLALAGVRSVGGARRLRFETDRVELDLQVEAEAGAALVTGQFVTNAASPMPIQDASFVIVAGDDDPIHGTTDHLGEFSMDTPPGAHLELMLLYGENVVRFDVPPEPRPAP